MENLADYGFWLGREDIERHISKNSQGTTDATFNTIKIISNMHIQPKDKYELFLVARHSTSAGEEYRTLWDFIEILIRKVKMDDNRDGEIAEIKRIICAFGMENYFFEFAMNVLKLIFGTFNDGPTSITLITEHNYIFLVNFYGVVNEFWMSAWTSWECPDLGYLVDYVHKRQDESIRYSNKCTKYTYLMIWITTFNPFMAMDDHGQFAELNKHFARTSNHFVAELCKYIIVNGNEDGIDNIIQFIVEFENTMHPEKMMKHMFKLFTIAIKDRTITNNIHLRGELLSSLLMGNIMDHIIENPPLFFEGISGYLHDFVNYDEELRYKITKFALVLPSVSELANEMIGDDMFKDEIPLYKFLYGILEIVSKLKNQFDEFSDSIDVQTISIEERTNEVHRLLILEEIGVESIFSGLIIAQNISRTIDYIEILKNSSNDILNIIITAFEMLVKIISSGDDRKCGIFKKAIGEAFMKSLIEKSIAILRLTKKMKYLYPTGLSEIDVFTEVGTNIVNRNIVNLVKGIIAILGYLSNIEGFGDYLKNVVGFSIAEFDEIIADLGELLIRSNICFSIDGIKRELIKEYEDDGAMKDPIDSSTIVKSMMFPNCDEIHSMETVIYVALKGVCPYTRKKLTIEGVIEFNKKHMEHPAI